MFEFFSRFQRIFFTGLAIVFGLLFALLGVSSSLFSEGDRREDRVVAKAVDGSSIMLSEIQELSRFLGSDQEDVDRQGSAANLCNDGVIRKDFVASGLKDLLVDAYLKESRTVSAETDREFIHVAAQFILNAAQLAKEKGFQVSFEEAKGDLLCNFQNALKKFPFALKSNLTFNKSLQAIGFHETSAAKIWQKVLLFRRYFQGVSEAAFVDRLPYLDFTAYARQEAKVCVYQWPEALHFQAEQDLLEFQAYLLAVAPPLEDPLGLPSQFYPLERVQEHYPELVEAAFHAEIAQISLPEVALRASVKEIWQWQCEEANWEKMRASFPYLSPASMPTERFLLLEKLSTSQRSQIDRFARIALLDQHPEWIEEAWKRAVPRAATIRTSNTMVSLPHIEKIGDFQELLNQASEGEADAVKALLSYCDNGRVVYRIERVVCNEPEHILSFEEAKNRSVLSGILDRHLRNQYTKIREKTPILFQSKEGSWKPFLEVKDLVARESFCKMFQKLESLQALRCPQEEKACLRFLPLTEAAFAAVKKNPFDPTWIQDDHFSLENQFKLIRKEKAIQRAEKENWMSEKAFFMPLNEWSQIRVAPDGDVSFFYLMEKKGVHETPIFEHITLGKELIAADAKRYLAMKLLETIAAKQSIVIPIHQEELSNEFF